MTSNQPIIRLSYSILSKWARGDWEGAIEAYIGHWPPPTPAMLAGREAHERWEAETRKTGKMPVELGGLPYRKPLLEKATKREVMLNDWLQFVGVLDVLDDETVGIDYKFGATSATQHANSFQHKVYQILYPKMKRFEYHAKNPYVPADESITVAICHLTDKTLEDGLEWVLTFGSEMRDYIVTNNIKKEIVNGRN
jgi:hypothetical protein